MADIVCLGINLCYNNAWVNLIKPAKKHLGHISLKIKLEIQGIFCIKKIKPTAHLGPLSHDFQDN